MFSLDLCILRSLESKKLPFGTGCVVVVVAIVVVGTVVGKAVVTAVTLAPDGTVSQFAISNDMSSIAMSLK